MKSGSKVGAETAWHLQESTEVLQAFQSSVSGLDTAEVERRQVQFGPNELTEEVPLSVPKLFLAQFKNALILILLAATIISAAIGNLVDSVVIAAAVLLCVILGFIFEYRAEKAIKRLRELAAPTAAVIRAGTEEKISTGDIVPGDILLLRPGNRVPADARLIESKKLTVDESPLTGESLPVSKDTAALTMENVNLADRSNMVYSGTTILEGRGRGVVTATGMQTEFGKIAGMLASEPEVETPLKRRINEIGRWLSIAYVIICVAIMAVGVLRGYEFLVMLIWGISLAVAIVPETLPLIITGTLAVGVQRMARKKAIVRKLPAVETLGCITTICADKTGTLTKNEMTVRTLYADGQMIEVTGLGYEPNGEFLNPQTGEQVDLATSTPLQMALQIAALCNDSDIQTGDAGYKINGDPTEGALVVAARKAGFEKQELEQRYPREGEIPFERERKRMTTIHRDTETGKIVAYVKGIPEALLQLSNRVYREVNGEIRQEHLSAEERNEIITLSDELASRAYRLIGVAYREVTEDEAEQLTPEAMEQNLIFVGLLGMTDPPRDEVKDAIADCKRAGIVPIMITGDHKLTAVAIAKELGIVPGSVEDDQVLTGAELDQLSDAEFERVANTVRVYSRVSPEHKLRIVEVLKRNGAVVAMTGDGINDAPALKRSDAGIAMNSGTDVAKEAADLVLTDNNFATIVAAIHEGRAIYDNVKKYLTYILSYGVAEVCLLAGAFFYGLPFPLIAIQILWANIVIEDLPAMGLGVDPPDPDIMDRPPRDPNERVFTGSMLKMLALMSAVIVIGCLGIFLHYLPRSALSKAQTMVFATFILYELINAFNCRSARLSLFRVGILSNRWLILGVIGSLLLLLFAVQLPVIAQFFHSAPLSGREWGLALGTSISIFIIVELYKAVKARRAQIGAA
ncbi:MAG: cation-translocating P-type ATPase [Methanomicrobia archaeon]|nr:cation-translocating P-type ATPase [Methanomicrobia archaeon]